MFWKTDPKEKAIKLFRSKKYDYFLIEFMLYVINFIGPNEVSEDDLKKYNYGLEDIHFEKDVNNVYSKFPKTIDLVCSKFQSQNFKFNFTRTTPDDSPEKRHFVTILFFLDEKLVINANFMGVVDQSNRVWYSNISLDEFHHSDYLLGFLDRQVVSIHKHQKRLEQAQLAENHKKFTF
jgi:hypothetical protein